MAGSGFNEMLELIYLPKPVEHVLTGKAILPALGCHPIIDAALKALLYSADLGMKPGKYGVSTVETVKMCVLASKCVFPLY